MKKIDNLRIKALKPLISPISLQANYPVSPQAAELINHTREVVSSIIHGHDSRLLVIIGPCSIHDPAAALEYSKKLKTCIEKYQTELCIVMRAYFEKPRTTIGWKGFLNDPNLNESFNINGGLSHARELLLQINNLGVAVGTEFLTTILPQYIADLISWAAIGARTVESPLHRELSSGLSMPVGFKNAISGLVEPAIDAVKTARYPHHFLGINADGVAAVVSTTGNMDSHIILRGGKITGSNYHAAAIQHASQLLVDQGLSPGVMIDCGHGNSQKDHMKQLIVIDNLCEQILAGNRNIMGVMIESYLLAGRQDIVAGKALNYGQSITDTCIGWEDTLAVLEQLAATVKQAREPNYAL